MTTQSASERHSWGCIRSSTRYSCCEGAGVATLSDLHPLKSNMATVPIPPPLIQLTKIPLPTLPPRKYFSLMYLFIYILYLFNRRLFMRYRIPVFAQIALGSKTNKAGVLRAASAPIFHGFSTIEN
jgi:hypothetical protein